MLLKDTEITAWLFGNGAVAKYTCAAIVLERGQHQSKIIWADLVVAQANQQSIEAIFTGHKNSFSHLWLCATPWPVASEPAILV
jgi:3-oxoacyl-[acyl-carrier-protein] synthase III